MPGPVWKKMNGGYVPKPRVAVAFERGFGPQGLCYLTLLACIPAHLLGSLPARSSTLRSAILEHERCVTLQASRRRSGYDVGLCD